MAEDIERLIAYDRRRYWLENGWSMRLRARRVEVTKGRPDGVKYSLTLHDQGGRRLLGFDNAHGLPRVDAFDHQHGFRNTKKMRPYSYVDGDSLLADFFQKAKAACESEGVAFDIVMQDLDEEADDDANDS
jgi:hypothetical protein